MEIQAVKQRLPRRILKRINKKQLRTSLLLSMLQSLTLDISDNDINSAVERVADWLEQTGGYICQIRGNKEKIQAARQLE